MKKKDVQIFITSTQKSEEDSDTTELITYGKYSYSDKEIKIEYEESETTGFEGSRVTLGIQGKSMVTMKRRGTAISDMIIEVGKKHHCYYGTPFGDFMVGISTDKINSNLSENGGNIYFKYTIDINSSLLSENEMQINVKEIDKV